VLAIIPNKKGRSIGPTLKKFAFLCVMQKIILITAIVFGVFSIAYVHIQNIYKVQSAPNNPHQLRRT
jgi:hypothetical protein